MERQRYSYKSSRAARERRATRKAALSRKMMALSDGLGVVRHG